MVSPLLVILLPLTPALALGRGYSTSWINPAAPPLWYYMNHSSLPNVVMRIANPDGPVSQQRLVWVAVRDIAAGDEIRFYYFDAPASWV